MRVLTAPDDYLWTVLYFQNMKHKWYKPVLKNLDIEPAWFCSFVSCTLLSVLGPSSSQFFRFVVDLNLYQFPAALPVTMIEVQALVEFWICSGYFPPLRLIIISRVILHIHLVLIPLSLGHGIRQLLFQVCDGQVNYFLICLSPAVADIFGHLFPFCKGKPLPLNVDLM